MKSGESSGFGDGREGSDFIEPGIVQSGWLEDVDLPSDGEVTVGIELPAEENHPILGVLQASAGAWSDEAHPELKTRDDVVRFVRTLRAGFERGL